MVVKPRLALGQPLRGQLTGNTAHENSLLLVSIEAGASTGGAQASDADYVTGGNAVRGMKLEKN